MGRFFELMGLATFNIFVAMALSSMFLSEASNQTYDSLSEDNIRQFVELVTKVSGGEGEKMDAYAVTSFLMNHIAEDGQFTTNLRYDIQGAEMDEQYMQMNKMDFISNILKGQKQLDNHESKIDIEYIEVADNGHKAKVITTSYERGIMPIPDFSGEARLMPILGMSYCTQNIILSKDKKIQMAGADCETNIKIQGGM